MTVEAERTRICALLEAWIAENALPDSWTVHRFIPGSLTTARLPAFIQWPGAADYTRPTHSHAGVTRVYPIRLMVKPITQGVSGQVEGESEAYIDSLVEYFNARPRLDLDYEPLNWIVSTEIIADSGIFSAPYPDLQNAPVYLTLEWRLRLTARRSLR